MSFSRFRNGPFICLEKTMKWRNFKTDPPYDAYEDDKNGFETDFVTAWFIYRYKHRPWIEKSNENRVSHTACIYSQNIFTDYARSMGGSPAGISPYNIDLIEVLYWVEAEDVRKLLKLSANAVFVEK